jgi:hypothetical protein
MTLMAIALVLAAVQPSPAPPPDAAAMRTAAARCGLPAGWLRFGHDADGDFADPSHARGVFHLTPEGVRCITDWAEQNHARLGFLSEPPPGPQALAILQAMAVTDAIRAVERCDLPIRFDPLDQQRVMLLARRDAPRGPLACVRAWVNAHPEEAQPVTAAH